jgi:hypothetical protein
VVTQPQRRNFTHTDLAIEQRTADTRANRRQSIGTAQYLRVANPNEQLLRALFLSSSPNNEVFVLAC